MERSITNDIGNLVTSKRLATLFGLTQRRIQQLTTENILTKDPSGKYNLPAAIQSYIDFIKMGDVVKPEQQADYWEERTAHEAAKRKLTEIKLAKLEQRMHDASDVEMVMVDMLTNLRTQLMGMPTILSSQLAGQTQERIYELLNKSIENKLLELSNYTPDLFHSEEVEEK